jgi:hypothetical protein
MKPDKRKLQSRLAKVSALALRAGTDGERQAAIQAAKRIRQNGRVECPKCEESPLQVLQRQYADSLRRKNVKQLRELRKKILDLTGSVEVVSADAAAIAGVYAAKPRTVK